MPRQYTATAPTVEVVCDVCGATYTMLKKSLARRTRRACSKKCGIRLRGPNPPESSKGGRSSLHALERFWCKVLVSGPDDCWLWTGAKDGQYRYGIFSIGAGRRERAHRFSYALAHSGIPDNTLICHTCDNPLCVNPAHLFAGTPKTNMVDCVTKGRFPYATRRTTHPHPKKLSEADVIAIRKSHATGVSIRALACAYSVHRKTIHEIVRRIIWANV
jgi:hypothetical protein